MAIFSEEKSPCRGCEFRRKNKACKVCEECRKNGKLAEYQRRQLCQSLGRDDGIVENVMADRIAMKTSCLANFLPTRGR